MSQYRKPKRIQIVLRLMVIGIILAALVGVIVPYLPSDTAVIPGQEVNLYDDPNTTEVIIENPSITGTTEVIVETGTVITASGDETISN